MGRIIRTIAILLDFLWLISFTAFVVVLGFLALEADGVSVDVVEYSEGVSLPFIEIDTVEDSVSVNASGDMGLVGSNWSERVQRCRENPKCTVTD